MRLEGARAVITGAASGIGAATARHFTGQGAEVIGVDLAGSDHDCDVADADAMLALAAELGPVDVLVNNAGITRDTTMKRMDHQKWQEVIDTNLGGCFNMAKAVFEGMTGRG